jgi:hypothetical protein
MEVVFASTNRLPAWSEIGTTLFTFIWRHFYPLEDIFVLEHSLYSEVETKQRTEIWLCTIWYKIQFNYRRFRLRDLQELLLYFTP